MDLYAPLLSACRADAGIELRTDAAVAGYEQDPDRVTARLATGEQLTGDALIGADGINSTVRQQVIGDGPPRVVGHTIFRSVIPAERVPAELLWNSVTLWAGPKWHFVHYLIGGGRYLNLAATIDNGATEPVVGEPVERAHVLAQFPGIGGAARRLLHLGDTWRTWTLRDRDPVAGWSDGRVLLIGDAAHPMLQYAAQGACQAIEDAVVLGDVIDDDFVKSFRRFTEQRQRRTRTTQVLARQMGRQLFHADGRLSRARNSILGSLTPDQMYQAVEWLHGCKTA
jgi:salicylate hydroxylase